MARHNGLQARTLITVAILAGGVVLMRTISRGEGTVSHRPLRELPTALGVWQGTDQRLEQRIVDAVGVDDYVKRAYMAPSGTVQLYIGYYLSQRTGDTIHSPKNCLPGAGWEPVRAERLAIPMPGTRPITVNEYLIAKGHDRQLVLYWYQSRGRTVASEYWAKFWMIHDAIARNRTDGALVRVVTPAVRGEAQARTLATDFVRALYPSLTAFVPE